METAVFVYEFSLLGYHIIQAENREEADLIMGKYQKEKWNDHSPPKFAFTLEKGKVYNLPQKSRNIV